MLPCPEFCAVILDYNQVLSFLFEPLIFVCVHLAVLIQFPALIALCVPLSVNLVQSRIFLGEPQPVWLISIGIQSAAFPLLGQELHALILRARFPSIHASLFQEHLMSIRVELLNL